MSWLREHKILLALCAVATLLALIPVLNAVLVIGSDWRGVPQSYGDEVLYYNQIHEIADGHFWYGNQYLIEHAGGPPVVIFAGHWLAAIPLWLGVPFVPALVLNFILWSIIFVLLGYWLLREMTLPKIWSAAGALFSYLTCYGLVHRSSSRQQVYPFFLLFYIALARFLKHPEKRSSIIFLGLSTGATFYIFSYLWQLVVVTLGLLFLYALVCRQWQLLRSTLLASALGGAVGMPALLYMAYLFKTYPYFLESIARFGLVNTHLPVAEVVYSGGWVGLLLALCVFVYWRIPALRKDKQFLFITVFVAITGLGLWITQGSNLITGKLLELGEHLRPFIGPWLPLAGLALLWALWERRAEVRGWSRLVTVSAAAALLFASLIFVNQYFYPYIDVRGFADGWHEEQGYAAPMSWIDAQQQEPVVVWSNLHNTLGYYIPTISRDYVLYVEGAEFTLVSDKEIQERYLVANYFDAPTVASLKADIANYVGRQNAYHRAKTIERGIKICRIVYFWDKQKDCGVPPTSVQLLGEDFFNGLEQKFTQDVQPNIKAYLKKYHVSYIIKDTVRDSRWTPQALGAHKVWSDGRYEVYRL